MAALNSVKVLQSELSTDSQLLLHQAALKYDHQDLQDLLDKGSNPNLTDKNKQTVLHVLLSDDFRGHLNESNLTKCVESVLKAHNSHANEMINAKDDFGETALSYAVSNGFESCAVLLVQHGAISSICTPYFPVVYSLATCIAKTMPKVMVEIFNSGITLEQEEIEGREVHQEKVMLDWRYVLQLSECHDYQRETEFLFGLSNVSPATREILFQHPLVSAFLHLKAASISWKLKAFRTFLMIYPGIYIFFVYYQYFELCPFGGDHVYDQQCSIKKGFVVYACFLLSVHVAVGFFFLYMLFRGNWNFLRNWKSLLVLLSLLLMGYPLWPAVQVWKESAVFDGGRVYPSAALATFLAWLMFLIQMQLVIPAIRIYLEMFATITISVLKVTALFIPLLVGFFMALNLMFLEKNTFQGIMKFILMTGNVDASEFEEKIRDIGSISPWYKYIASSFTIAFFLIINVIFLNFLLGVSIEDVQKLKRNAKVTVLSNTITNLFISDPLNKVFTKDTGKIIKSYYYPSNPAAHNTVKLPENIKTKIKLLLKPKHVQESS